MCEMTENTGMKKVSMTLEKFIIQNEISTPIGRGWPGTHSWVLVFTSMNIHDFPEDGHQAKLH